MASLRISLLGGFEARLGTGKAIDLHGRKTQALLAYLALPPGEPRSRDKLVALLWSDRGEQQARGSLRQALAELRKALGDADPPPLVAGRDEVHLDAGAVEVDAVELERLVADGAPEALERAAELYQEGDLLDGIGVHDPAFEDWLRTERERLHDRAREAFSRLLDHQTGIGTTDAAIATARRLLALDPLQESTHRALMKLYADRGDRAMALKQYQACRDVLRAELGLKLDAETEHLINEIREGVSETGEAEKPASSPAAATEPLALPDKPSIAVLPFVNMSGDPEQEYFTDGITEDIITGLSRFSELFIIARNSAFTYKGRPAKVQDVGRELGVQYIVEGSVRKAGNRVRVTAQLIEAATGSHIWADRYDRQLVDIFAIQDEVTEAIVARVADRVKGAATTLSRSRPKQSVTAYDLVLQSRPYRTSMTRSGSEQAARLLTQAIALDPDYSLAHASLAFVRAGDVDDGWSADPDAALRDAMASARQAVALDNSDGYAHASLAYAHYLSGNLDPGNLDRAVHEVHTALSLNPNHVNIIMTAGWISVAAGDPEAGIEHIQRARRLNPYMGGFELWTLGSAYFGAKRYEEAIDAFSKVTDPPAVLYLDLAAACAYLGRDSDARDNMNTFLDRARNELNPFPGDDPQAWRRYFERTCIRRRKEDFEHIIEGARKAGLPV